MFSYPYPRLAVTVDAVVFHKEDSGWNVLLIQRKFPPFEKQWALPGGFLNMNETLEDAVERELQEETGLKGVRFKQFHAFSGIDRDPRHRTITVAFWGILNSHDEIIADSDAMDAKWFPIDHLPTLAFDHKEIVEIGIKKFKEANYS